MKYWNSNVSNLTPFPLRVDLLVMHVAQLIVPASLPVSNLPPFARRQRFAPLAACSDSAAQPNAFKRLWFTQFEQLVLGSGKGNIFFMWLLYAHFSWTNFAPPVIEFLSSHHSDAHSCCCSISTNIAVSATMHFLGQAGGGWRHRWFLHGQSSDHGCTSFDRAPVGSDIQPGEVACLMLFQACN